MKMPKTVFNGIQKTIELMNLEPIETRFLEAVQERLYNDRSYRRKFPQGIPLNVQFYNEALAVKKAEQMEV